MNASFSIVLPCEIDSGNLPEGITLERDANNYIEFSENGRNWPIYIVTFTSTVAVGLFTDFLYDAIKKHSKKEPETVMVEYEEASFKNGEVERLIRMKITKTQKADN